MGKEEEKLDYKNINAFFKLAFAWLFAISSVLAGFAIIIILVFILSFFPSDIQSTEMPGPLLLQNSGLGYNLNINKTTCDALFERAIEENGTIWATPSFRGWSSYLNQVYDICLDVFVVRGVENG